MLCRLDYIKKKQKSKKKKFKLFYSSLQYFYLHHCDRFTKIELLGKME
jgi:hypothetical protein